MSVIYAPPESLLESRSFRRLLAFSLAGHVALFLVLTFRPHRTALLISPSPVMVSVVDVPKPAAAAKPAAKKPAPPKPETVPEPAKPKPVVKEVVIPKEPAPVPAKPKPVAKPEPAPKSAEELLAELTKKVEERNPPQPMAAEATGPAVPIAGGPGVFDPLFSPWVARVKLAVRANWSGAQLCKGVPVFNLEVADDGALRDIELAQSSGDRYCDESAERAIRKSDPLPAPPRGALALELGMSLKDTL